MGQSLSKTALILLIGGTATNNTTVNGLNFEKLISNTEKTEKNIEGEEKFKLVPEDTDVTKNNNLDVDVNDIKKHVNVNDDSNIDTSLGSFLDIENSQNLSPDTRNQPTNDCHKGMNDAIALRYSTLLEEKRCLTECHSATVNEKRKCTSIIPNTRRYCQTMCVPEVSGRGVINIPWLKSAFPTELECKAESIPGKEFDKGKDNKCKKECSKFNKDGDVPVFAGCLTKITQEARVRLPSGETRLMSRTTKEDKWCLMNCVTTSSPIDNSPRGTLPSDTPRTALPDDTPRTIVTEAPGTPRGTPRANNNRFFMP